MENFEMTIENEQFSHLSEDNPSSACRALKRFIHSGGVNCRYLCLIMFQITDPGDDVI